MTTQNHPKFRSTAAAVRDSSTGGLLLRLLLVWAALLPIQLQNEELVNLAPSDIVLIAIVILGGRELRLVNRAWSRWPALLAAVIVVSTAVTAWRTGVLSQWALTNKSIGIVVLVGTYVVITSIVRSWQDLIRVARAFVISVTLSNALFVVLALSDVWTSVIVTVGRLRGLMIDPNAYGGVLLLALTLTIMDPQTIVPNRWIRWLVYIGLPVGIFLTSSRSAWLGLVLALVVGLLMRPTAVLRTLTPAVAAIAGYVWWRGPEWTERFLNISTRSFTVDNRLETIETALDQFYENPVFGSGIGTVFESTGTIVHNTPIWFLAEFGVVGAVVLGGFFVWTLRMAWAVWRRSKVEMRGVALGLLLGDVAMIGLSLGIEALYQRHWWLVIGLIGSAYAFQVPGPAERFVGRMGWQAQERFHSRTRPEDRGWAPRRDLPRPPHGKPGNG